MNHCLIQDFVKKYSCCSFTNSDFVFSSIESNKVTSIDCFSEPAKLARDFIKVWKIRRSRFTQPGITKYVTKLGVEVSELVEGLENKCDEYCEHWHIKIAPKYNVSLFGLSDSARVLGCIKTVDANLISEDERLKLWGALA